MKQHISYYQRRSDLCIDWLGHYQKNTLGHHFVSKDPSVECICIYFIRETNVIDSVGAAIGLANRQPILDHFGLLSILWTHPVNFLVLFNLNIC